MIGTGETDLGPMSEKVAEFLPEAGLVEEAPDLEGLFDPSFTEDFVKREGG
jgi:hypothetical protein